MPVYVIVEAIAEGNTVQELLEAYPFLTEQDIHQALRFAAKLLPKAGPEPARAPDYERYRPPPL